MSVLSTTYVRTYRANEPPPCPLWFFGSHIPTYLSYLCIYMHMVKKKKKKNVEVVRMLADTFSN